MPSSPGQDSVEISILVPMYNEGENIVALLDRLEPAVEALDRSYEIICVDDGSIQRPNAARTHIERSARLLSKPPFGCLLDFGTNLRCLNSPTLVSVGLMPKSYD